MSRLRLLSASKTITFFGVCYSKLLHVIKSVHCLHQKPFPLPTRNFCLVPFLCAIYAVGLVFFLSKRKSCSLKSMLGVQAAHIKGIVLSVTSSTPCFCFVVETRSGHPVCRCVCPPSEIKPVPASPFPFFDSCSCHGYFDFHRKRSRQHWIRFALSYRRRGETTAQSWSKLTAI